MNALDTSTPVVVLSVEVAGLAAARTLGRLGVPVYGIHPRQVAGMASRFWRRTFTWDLAHRTRDETLAFLREVAATAGGQPLLLATNDITAELVAAHAADLAPHYRFPNVDLALLRSLMNKHSLATVAARHEVPTAHVAVPASLDDVSSFAATAAFPVMVKGIDPTRRGGRVKIVAHTRDALLGAYAAVGPMDPPNVMLQEYIPGDDATGWTFYGYFNAASESLAASTARKVRLAPADTGVIALGVVDDLADARTACVRFMSAVGYRGPVNIGGKFDRRDGRYKVLDVNARLGASFRLCAADSGLDVVQVMYRDLTGQPVPREAPRLGRRWWFEEDAFAAWTYIRRGELGVGAWLKTLRGIDECAWWARDDPRPFGRWLLSRLKKSAARGRAASNGGA